MKSIILSLTLLYTWPAAIMEETASVTIAQDTGVLAADVFDRLVILLHLIPTRWESLPASVIPLSGRSPKEAVKAASHQQA